MECEVIIVGAGIGGLATAALLAARGVNVCVFERQSRVGGCVANFERLDYTFEPTAGLYSGWESEGTYERLFSELPLGRPEVDPLTPAYIVRLPDRTDVAVTSNSEEFTFTLRDSFPECADSAITFYQKLSDILHVPDARLAKDGHQLTEQRLVGTSVRFRRFVDVQLQTFTQRASDGCSLLTAAHVLTAAERGIYAIRGGAQALADVLASAIKAGGGTIRLNAPVLRLAYGSNGSAIGVDLLSGQRVIATRAIVSNLTIWDTYGKLIGPGRTPQDLASQLKQLRAWGAYLVFASMNEIAVSRLKTNHFLVLTDWGQDVSYAPNQMQFVFSAAPQFDTRAPAERAATICTFTDVDEWFSFHEDETAHEEQDQATLEALWTRLHLAMPELGDGIEVIETATPSTFYETTRRRLGMVGAPLSNFEGLSRAHHTSLPNVFMIGDTISGGFGLEGVCASAIALANRLAPR